MYRMMIVDDEPFIADSLQELIEEANEWAVEVHKAYSGVDALGVIENLKMDIVLTDIRMPVMDGLELQARVLARWPRCKVIFLTGHEHFEYVQTAIRLGGFDYILKTEEDSRIIAALSKAIRVLHEEFELRSVLEQAQRKYRDALLLMRHKFFGELLEGEAMYSKASLQQRFNELGIGLDPGKSVWLVAGRVDAWSSDHTPYDKSLFLYGIQNVAEEYFSPQAAFFEYDDRQFFYWIVSFREAIETERQRSILQGLLESVQDTCGKLLPLTVSFAVGSDLVGIPELAAAKRKSALLLRGGLGGYKEAILWETMPMTPSRLKSTEIRHPVFGRLSGFVRELRLGLDAGDVAAVLAMCETGANAAYSHKDEFSIHAERYFSLALVFVSYMNDNGLCDQPELRDVSHGLLQMDKHGSWQEAFRYFAVCAERLVRHRAEKQAISTNEWVAKIHRYIDSRLGEDLTLVGIAEQVYLNPAYLSRLYKQVTGQGLFEYIKERRLEEAQYLLRETTAKIHEIGARIGMESPTYFSRFFRKETTLSPQEYRDGKKVNRSTRT